MRRYSLQIDHEHYYLLFITLLFTIIYLHKYACVKNTFQLCNTQVVNLLKTSEDAWEIPRSEIEVGDKLGQGNYGSVFKGRLSLEVMSPKIHAHKQEMELEGNSHVNVAVKMLRRKRWLYTKSSCSNDVVLY